MCLGYREWAKNSFRRFHAKKATNAKFQKKIKLPTFPNNTYMTELYDGENELPNFPLGSFMLALFRKVP